MGRRLALPLDESQRRRQYDGITGGDSITDLVIFRLNQIDTRFDRLDMRLEAMPDRFAATIGVATEQIGKHVDSVEGMAKANASRIGELEKWQAGLKGGLSAGGRAITASLAIACAILGALASRILGG